MAVTLSNLYNGAATTKNSTAGSILRQHAAFLSTMNAAVYFAPAARLFDSYWSSFTFILLSMGGPHSRDYDFVFGAAGMEWYNKKKILSLYFIIIIIIYYYYYYFNFYAQYLIFSSF